ncbi:hypothetical protein RhiirC2_801087 [Rhizophagus irregularis]|uniref:Uncharacterized protein n=1 Tax=Rhizophagus irregularis TaxID=588596 RepID=A0A2N1M2R7_9GLOM|nr:hypothetical protein RhiirC2_801087 [Rhizophagus irregularis]
MTYNLSPDKMILSRERAEQSEKGLYAIVLEYLSSKRNEMKKRLAPLKEKKENMDLVIGLMDKGLSLPGAIEQVLANTEEKKRASLSESLHHFINKKKHEFIAEYDSICFDCSCLDAKQYALKVYMNTFYGTAGDSKSPFFLRELAGGPNFNKKLFIRGVEVVKRGQSKHFCEVGKKVMEESMRLDNTRTLRRIVEDMNKAGDNKADDGGVDGDDLDEDDEIPQFPLLSIYRVATSNGHSHG